MCKDQHSSFAITSVLRLGRNISLTNEKIEDVGGRMFLLYSNILGSTRNDERQIVGKSVLDFGIDAT
jgi:hypothetical protein